MRRRRDLLSEFYSYTVDELGRSQATARHYLYGLKALVKWCDLPIERIGSSELRRFKREADYAPATIQTVVVAMHQFHRWGSLEGYWRSNGILDVPTPRVTQSLQPPIPIATTRLLLTSCQTALEYRVIFLGLYAGCRISESARMRESHFGYDRLVFTGKGNKQRVVPLHPELKAVKGEILSRHPASEGVLHSSLDRIRKRLDARDGWGRLVKSHALRRTFATTLYEGGTPYEVVAKLLGHGADVTARYAQIRYPKMAEALASLNYFSGEPTQLQMF